MVVTVADPGDPTADPSKAWPADRRTVDVGTLTVERIKPEPDGPCRDINYDPTVLPDGIAHLRRPVPGRPLGRLCGVLRPAHRRGRRLSSQRRGGSRTP